MAINDFITYVESEFYVNKKEVSESEFISAISGGIQKLSKSTPVNVTFEDNGKTVTLNLFKEFDYSKINRIKKLLNDYINLNYDKYEAETDDTSVFVSCISYVGDVEETILSAEQDVAENIDVQYTKPDIEDVGDVEATLLPTLTNKAYNSFVKTCESVDDFLHEYPNVSNLFISTIRQSDFNKIASAIIAPIQCWDKLGEAIKMSEEEFLLLKRNLIRLSIPDTCLYLSSSLYGGWESIFDRLEKYKLNNTKIVKSQGQFLTKTKVTIIDKKTKKELGSAMLMFSCIITNQVLRNKEKLGNFFKMKSNISYDLIVK